MAFSFGLVIWRIRGFAVHSGETWIAIEIPALVTPLYDTSIDQRHRRPTLSLPVHFSLQTTGHHSLIDLGFCRTQIESVCALIIMPFKTD